MYLFICLKQNYLSCYIINLCILYIISYTYICISYLRLIFQRFTKGLQKGTVTCDQVKCNQMLKQLYVDKCITSTVKYDQFSFSNDIDSPTEEDLYIGPPIIRYISVYSVIVGACLPTWCRSTLYLVRNVCCE